MKTNRIQELLEKHIAFTCDQSEQEELAQLIESISDEKLKPELLKLLEQYEPAIYLSDKEKKQKLDAILESEKTTIKLQRKSINYYRTVAAVAASVVIIFSTGWFFTQKSINKSSEQAMVIKTPTVSPNQATSYIRNITLADGSMVILQKGSTVKVNSGFGNQKREIVLTGEAYFDIKHDAKRPFIIHTGDVKTTVLGTAFNIKAWPNEKNVVVLVTRGKVKVEKQEKTLALLTKNMQLKVQDQENKPVEIEEVAAEKIVTSWTREDLVFTNTSFDDITKVLNKRYGVNIKIKDEELSKSLIVTSFSGRENLSSILNILCSLHSGTHYTTINEQEITIERN
jgi:transmembrane sensor